jgi:replication initiation protein RepC
MQIGNVTTPFGRRPMTLAMLTSQVKELDPEKSIDKWKLYRAVCEARTRLGITDRCLALLNALLTFHPGNELVAGEGLVVFPSNASLSARAHGMSETTMRRHLAALVDADLITRKDSANGKRFRRDGEAYGFSLAPLLGRAEEIEIIADEIVVERRLLQRAREKVTINRRDITKLIDVALELEAPGNWQAIHEQFRHIVLSIPRNATLVTLTEALDELDLLREGIVNTLETQSNAEEMNGNPSHSERHIQNSKPDLIIESEPAMKKELKSFPLGLVLQACPEIAMYGPGGGISNWRDLMSAAVVVRSTLGVSPSAYQAACEVLGPENAATVMACILERAGHINSAGGYLRTLTERARHGEFRLGPMFMALLKANTQVGAKAG